MIHMRVTLDTLVFSRHILLKNRYKIHKILPDYIHLLHYLLCYFSLTDIIFIKTDLNTPLSAILYFIQLPYRVVCYLEEKRLNTYNTKR